MRKLLEQYTFAWNIYLKEVIPTMDIVILLRNAHPSYRDVFAREALNTGLISRDDAKEFLKIV